MSLFSKIIRDGKGNILGSNREVAGYGSDVSDRHGNRIGSTTTFGTFTNHGTRETDTPDAGFLIEKTRKKNEW